jgi:signal peptidase II
MAPHIFMGNGLSRSSLLGWPGVAALAVLALDQLTKFMVYTIWPIPGENELVVIPGFFSLVHWRNLGAAWGIFARHTWLLAVVSLVAAVLLMLFFRRLSDGKPVLAMTYGVLLGGIVGNLIDRAFFPEGVVDFLAFRWWPAFNIADSAITCSVIFLIVHAVFFERDGEKPAE